MASLSPQRSSQQLSPVATDAAPAARPLPLSVAVEVMAPEAREATGRRPGAAGLLREETLGLPEDLIPKAQPASAPVGANLGHVWSLDPSLTFLNHGSYGSTPKAALRAQQQYRERMERDPVRFFKVDLEHLVDGVREKLGAFVNANPADIAPICNATWALCTILKATQLRAGDEVLITDHEYGSLTNELERICAATGAKVVKAEIPFPLAGPQVVIERYLAKVTPRTRLAFISHITSTSSLIFPVASILRELNQRGIDTVLDGAHSPGQIPVDLRALAPTYFVGSGHKWLSGPKGSGFMVVRPDKQHLFRPVALSSRANKIRPERALFLRDFDYQGTDDYTSLLALPHAMEAMGSLLPGGWPALMRSNHEMVLRGRDIVCDALGITPHCPDAMLGSMATILIPEPPEHLKDRKTVYDDALQDALFDRHRVVAPIWRLACNNARVVRISAHLYNTPEQYATLARALKVELAREWASA